MSTWAAIDFSISSSQFFFFLCVSTLFGCWQRKTTNRGDTDGKKTIFHSRKEQQQHMSYTYGREKYEIL